MYEHKNISMLTLSKYKKINEDTLKIINSYVPKIRRANEQIFITETIKYYKQRIEMITGLQTIVYLKIYKPNEECIIM